MYANKRHIEGGELKMGEIEIIITNNKGNKSAGVIIEKDIEINNFDELHEYVKQISKATVRKFGGVAGVIE